MKANTRPTFAAVTAALLAGSHASHAALPTEITELFTDTAADAALVVTAGVVAYAAYRGGITVLSVAKRMLSKAGL